MEELEFNSMLLEVSKLLNENDLKQMKFLSKDIIKKRDMEKVNMATDLFTELQSREKLTKNDTSFLKRLLAACEKQTAIRIVEQYENNVNSVLRNGEAPANNLPQVQQQAFQQAQPIQPTIPPHINQSVPRSEDPVVTQKLASLKQELNFLTKNLGREWRFYVRALGLEDIDVDTVETDYPRSLRDQIYQSLVLWVKQFRESATKESLITGLLDGSVERNDLASKLKNGKY